jgi:hypothetical protein
MFENNCPGVDFGADFVMIKRIGLTDKCVKVLVFRYAEKEME